MRLYHLAAFFALVANASSLRPDDSPTGQANPIEVLEHFISRYHQKPAPDAVPQQLKTLLAEATLKQLSPHVFELIAHSFGHMGRGNVTLVRLYETSYMNTGERGKAMLIRILRICGDVGTVDQFKKWESTTQAEELKKEIASARQFLEDPKHTLPRDQPAKVPQDLDLLWADFLITGDYVPVSRILDVFDRPDQFRTAIESYLKKNTGEKKRQILFAKLDELKLLQPGSKDKLLPGNLDLKVDENKLPEAIRFAKDILGEPVEKLYAGILLKTSASWSFQSNLKQHPRLVELLKEHNEKRPAESQAIIKKWLLMK